MVGEDISGKDIRGKDITNLVDFAIASIPLMQRSWGKQYDEGYETRMQGGKRCTDHARRRGAWFRGYDAADKELKENLETTSEK